MEIYEKLNKEPSNIKKWHNKKPQILFIVLFSILILGITALDIFTSDRYFSENENRILASKPTATVKNILDGTFSENYETYITDQFLVRDFWIQLKNYTEISLQKKELNGVYLAKDGSLIEKHSSTDVDEKKAVAKQQKLVKETKAYADLLGADHVKVMLVPTANMILTDKLPQYTNEFAQFQYLDKIRESLPEPDMLLSVGETLLEHKQEDIYYKTDHHWTTWGAYYGYLTWAKSLGITPVSEFNIQTLSDTFLGTLHSKINVRVPYDTIDIMHNADTLNEEVKVNYIYENKVTNSLYDMEKLQTKDQYGVFMGGNFPLIQISTPVTNKSDKKSNLLIIKDSYANSFAPFAINHFENVYLLDPRYYRDNIQNAIAEYEISDVLLLYDVIHFIDNY